MVGYKNQSAIGNLENRKDGSGGNKIERIADALNVSVDWLFNGPDCDNVPFLPPKTTTPTGLGYLVKAAEPTSITSAYWPFSTPIETFRRLITLDNLEILNGQIETMIRQRDQGGDHPRQNGSGW